jgi:transcriptional regulator with GAF, ATPase, and Fis domain
LHTQNESVAESLQELAEAMADRNSVAAVLDQLSAIFQRQIGYKIFTLSILDTENELTAKRIWTSHPREYPVNGQKSKIAPEWYEQVIKNKASFICENKDDVRRVLYDHKVIFSLGCGSALNIPLRLLGKVIGTINILHDENWFSPARVEKAERLAALAYAPMLLARCADSAS